MDRNCKSNFYNDYRNHYNTMYTIVYNEFKRKQIIDSTRKQEGESKASNNKVIAVTWENLIHN